MANLDRIKMQSATEEELGALAERLAPLIGAGDVIALHGPLGAGKTSFCRALIRALTEQPTEEVPSPTFTLAQPYEAAAGLAIWHFDLYRLEQPEEALELGIEDAFIDSASLIEWPEKLGALLPEDHLSVELDFAADTDAASNKGRRDITLAGGPSWKARMALLAKDGLATENTGAL